MGASGITSPIALTRPSWSSAENYLATLNPVASCIWRPGNDPDPYRYKRCPYFNFDVAISM